jgi:hypothetical protein
VVMDRSPSVLSPPPARKFVLQNPLGYYDAIDCQSRAVERSFPDGIRRVKRGP